MSITREQAKTITAEVKEAVEAVLGRHGLTLTKANTTFGDEYSLKIAASVVSADGVNEAGVKAWERNAEFFGLPLNGIGLTFKSAGRTFKVTGLNLKARKRPIVTLCEDDGKTYVWEDSDGLKAKLHAAATANA